ncbi:hypothetical protein AGLY_017130 [Aphis glycines]|uniref:Integrase catalytic domain-containing protein n=1 Tax=Aphis glycines TaxID=307491 RepID=A0A6G0SVX1_APHGL|nr:hypothetical protein AGLY_017130 [Aphis glycines]
MGKVNNLPSATPSRTLLADIIQARINIKKKYDALKTGRFETESLINNTFSSIIDPLNKIRSNIDTPRTHSSQHQFKPPPPPPSTQPPSRSTSSPCTTSLLPSSPPSLSDVDKRHSIALTYPPTSYNLNELYRNWTKRELDKIYGPRKLTDGTFVLGNKEIQFIDNRIHIKDDDYTYSITSGLIDLLFSKSPASDKYTNTDLKTYKHILNQTSAHKTIDGTRIRSSIGVKYMNIISRLFKTGGGDKSGSGINMRLQKHNIVYWNDPNELVDRLRLLYSSLAAGNTGHAIAAELHGAARRTYPRRRVIVYGKNDLFQADLVDMQQYSNVNKGYKYILCVIDCFTKYAWAVALKSKKGEEVSTAANKIFAQNSPNLLHVDRGREFYNKHFETLVKKYNIKMYSTFSVLKASIVERFNRTLKERMYKQFTGRGSRVWTTILPSLIDDYNNVGDKVRISVYKGVFTKGYLPNWSTEIFTIIKVNRTTPSIFILQDYTGCPIAGGFYAEEIRKTKLPDDYLVEKVIRTKGRRAFVRWLDVFGGSPTSRLDKRIADISEKFTEEIDSHVILIEINNTKITALDEKLDVHSRASQHWIFKHTQTPHTAKSKAVNIWLFRNYHQLSMDCGDVQYSEIDRILKSLHFECIYVKGEEKRQIIQDFIPQIDVIDMGADLDCPRLNQLHQQLDYLFKKMNLLKSLKEQSEVRNLSIDDLVVDVSYPIKAMKKLETAFGMAVSCALEDSVMGGTINYKISSANEKFTKSKLLNMTNKYDEFNIQEIINEAPVFPRSMLESMTTPYSAITPPEAFSPDLFPSTMIESMTTPYSAITPPEAFSPDLFPSTMIESMTTPYSAITPPEAFSPALSPSSMSPSMLHMLPLKTPREFHKLIVGIIKQCETKSFSWGDDENENHALNIVMERYENTITAASDDWGDNEEENMELNKVMDMYES